MKDISKRRRKLLRLEREIRALKKEISRKRKLIEKGFQEVNEEEKQRVRLCNWVIRLKKLQREKDLLDPPQHLKSQKRKERVSKIKSLSFGYVLKLLGEAYALLRLRGIRVFLLYTYKYLLFGREYFKLGDKFFEVDYILRTRPVKFEKLESRPKISVITPVYNLDPRWLKKCVKSVREQIYTNWELCLYDDASTNAATLKYLKELEGQDPRIKIKFGKRNKHISGASNEALKMATGEFVALLDNDDELAREALWENVKLLNKHPDTCFIYSDEDKVDQHGDKMSPFFKPDWSPDLLLSMMYTGHLGVYRRSIIKEIGGFREGYEGSQDYDLVLRFVEKIDSSEIRHIPRILYHWRKVPGSTASLSNAKNYAYVSAQKALEDYLKRNGIKGKMENGFSIGSYRVKREIEGSPLVSILIPFEGKSKSLKRLVNSVFRKTGYRNFEVLIAAKKSKNSFWVKYRKKRMVKRALKDNKLKVLEFADSDLNYPELCNRLSGEARGKYLLFLKSNLKVTKKKWLISLLEQVQRREVGIAGAKTSCSLGELKSVGIAFDRGALINLGSKNIGGYRNRINVIGNLSAFSSDCLVVSKFLFEELGGFNSRNFPTLFSVDFCLKARKKGFLIVYTPYAELRSRKEEETDSFRTKNRKEFRELRQRWSQELKRDPYYNENLAVLRKAYLNFKRE